eukprot:XP_008676394.1 putative glycine-rich cell wall structural protein 1 [Zea mays]
MDMGRRGRGLPRHAGSKRKRALSPPSEDFDDSEYSEEASSKFERSPAPASPLASFGDSDDSMGLSTMVDSSEEWSGGDSDDKDDGSSSGDDGGSDGSKGDDDKGDGDGSSSNGKGNGDGGDDSGNGSGDGGRGNSGNSGKGNGGGGQASGAAQCHWFKY